MFPSKGSVCRKQLLPLSLPTPRERGIWFSTGRYPWLYVKAHINLQIPFIPVNTPVTQTKVPILTCASSHLTCSYPTMFQVVLPHILQLPGSTHPQLLSLPTPPFFSLLTSHPVHSSLCPREVAMTSLDSPRCLWLFSFSY